MKYPGWQKFEEYKKLAYYWIIYRRGEPIPGELKFEGWQMFKGYYGILVHEWIKHRPGESIPEDMKVEGWQTDRDKFENTPLISWIICR